MNRRHFLPILPAAALLAGCKQDTTPKLKVGMEASYPPFEFKNENGELDGVDVRIAEALAAHLGLKLEISEYAFAGIIDALKGNQIDCIISAMTATASGFTLAPGAHRQPQALSTCHVHVRSARSRRPLARFARKRSCSPS